MQYAHQTWDPYATDMQRARVRYIHACVRHVANPHGRDHVTMTLRMWFAYAVRVTEFARGHGC